MTWVKAEITSLDAGRAFAESPQKSALLIASLAASLRDHDELARHIKEMSRRSDQHGMAFLKLIETLKRGLE